MRRQQVVDWLPVLRCALLGMGRTLNGVASALGATPGGAALPSVGSVTFYAVTKPSYAKESTRSGTKRRVFVYNWYTCGV